MSELSRFDYDGGYETYKKEQIAANHRKLSWEFKRPQQMDEIKKTKPEAANILCHGTRRGGEQQAFINRYPNAYVIGSEISDTATQFPHTVEHDFNTQRQEWVGKFDIVYSNAFDHAFDPDVTIEVWKEQLAPEGVMFLHWNVQQNIKSHKVDPISGTMAQFMQFLERHGFKCRLTVEKDLVECRLE